MNQNLWQPHQWKVFVNKFTGWKRFQLKLMPNYDFAKFVVRFKVFRSKLLPCQPSGASLNPENFSPIGKMSLAWTGYLFFNRRWHDKAKANKLYFIHIIQLSSKLRININYGASKIKFVNLVALRFLSISIKTHCRGNKLIRICGI